MRAGFGLVSSGFKFEKKSEIRRHIFSGERNKNDNEDEDEGTFSI